MKNQENQKDYTKKLDKYYKSLQDSAVTVPDKFADLLKKSKINLD